MNEQEERRKRVEICLDILNQEMSAYLEEWKKTGGGTKGHEIRSMKHRFLEFTKFFKNYLL